MFSLSALLLFGDGVSESDSVNVFEFVAFNAVSFNSEIIARAPYLRHLSQSDFPYCNTPKATLRAEKFRRPKQLASDRTTSRNQPT